MSAPVSGLGHEASVKKVPRISYPKTGKRLLTCFYTFTLFVIGFWFALLVCPHRRGFESTWSQVRSSSAARIDLPPGPVLSLEPLHSHKLKRPSLHSDRLLPPSAGMTSAAPERGQIHGTELRKGRSVDLQPNVTGNMQKGDESDLIWKAKLKQNDTNFNMKPLGPKRTSSNRPISNATTSSGKKQEDFDVHKSQAILSQVGQNLTTRFWPTIYYIGTGKASSTSLWHYLKRLGRSPFCGGRVLPGEPSWFDKEPNFFNTDSRYRKGANYYLLRYVFNKKCREEKRKQGHRTPIFMDFSVRAMHHGATAMRMANTIPKELHPKLKFIAVLREPTSRDRSWYYQIKKFQHMRQYQTYGHYVRWKLSQEAATARSTDLQDGFYDVHLAQWLKYFHRNQTLVLNFDEVITNPNSTLQTLMKFLGYEDADWFTAKQYSLPRKNMKQHQDGLVLDDVCPRDCLALQELYRPHNTALYSLLRTHPGPREEPEFQPFRTPNCQTLNCSGAEKMLDQQMRGGAEAWLRVSASKANRTGGRAQ